MQASKKKSDFRKLPRVIRPSANLELKQASRNDLLTAKAARLRRNFMSRVAFYGGGGPPTMPVVRIFHQINQKRALNFCVCVLLPCIMMYNNEC